jgi:hypothetical protein
MAAKHSKGRNRELNAKGLAGRDDFHVVRNFSSDVVRDAIRSKSDLLFWDDVEVVPTMLITCKGRSVTCPTVAITFRQPDLTPPISTHHQLSPLSRGLIDGNVLCRNNFHWPD